MAIITRQLSAKILIPDACHIVKPAILCEMAKSSGESCCRQSAHGEEIRLFLKYLQF
ncbi:MAG: hypothetical protein AB1Z31_26720 [Desulfobacterales bacterium]